MEEYRAIFLSAFVDNVAKSALTRITDSKIFNEKVSGMVNQLLGNNAR
jgi:hypothetical protein